MIACVPVTGDLQKKKLWINRKIFLFFPFNGTVRQKLEGDGPYNSIIQLDYLKSLFPEESFTVSSLQYFSTHIYLFLQFFCCVKVQFGFWVSFSMDFLINLLINFLLMDFFLSLFSNVITVCSRFLFGLDCLHKGCAIVSIAVKSNTF